MRYEKTSAEIIKGYQLHPVGVLSSTPQDLITEMNPVSKMLCFLVSRILDDRQIKKRSHSESCTPSSEPFEMDRIC